jgi:hypothetical protein
MSIYLLPNENIQLMIIQSFRYKLMKLKVMKVITLILHAKQRFFLSKLNMSFLLELYKLRDADTIIDEDCFISSAI